MSEITLIGTFKETKHIAPCSNEYAIEDLEGRGTTTYFNTKREAYLASTDCIKGVRGRLDWGEEKEVIEF